jgi:hypothetical protein
MDAGAVAYSADGYMVKMKTAYYLAVKSIRNDVEAMTYPVGIAVNREPSLMSRVPTGRNSRLRTGRGIDLMNLLSMANMMTSCGVVTG